jgi:hypothetical protein
MRRRFRIQKPSTAYVVRACGSNAAQVFNHNFRYCAVYVRILQGEALEIVQRIGPILLKYATACAKKHGPFYAGDKNDTINIFGTCGSVPLEMMLIAFLFNKSAALNK